MNFDLIAPHMYEIVGVAGFMTYVATYSMLTLRVLSGDSILYFSLNLSAATLVMIGLTASFNLASALIQGFWITMSIVGISIRLVRGSRQRNRFFRAQQL